jgi:excisionase family DNA binding protein
MGSSHLTTKEAAIKMGVPLRTIQSMIQDGRLKAERIGRDYMIRPDALNRITRASKSGRGGTQMKTDFWIAFKKLAEADERSSLTLPNPRPDPWMAIGLGSNCRVAAHFKVRNPSGPVIGVDLTLGRGAERFFPLLKQEKKEIEEQLGMELVWDPRPNNVESWILIQKHADPSDRLAWSAQHDWLYRTLKAFYEVFAPRIKRLAEA